MPNHQAQEIEQKNINVNAGEIRLASRRKLWKFAAAMVAIIVFGFVAAGATFLPMIWREWKARRMIQDIERQYREDTYGGTTPEETFNLFLDALKKGDLELASKYAALDKRESVLEGLRRLQRENRLDSLTEVLSLPHEGRYITEDWYRIEIFHDGLNGKELVTFLSIIKPSLKTGFRQSIWKIDSI